MPIDAKNFFKLTTKLKNIIPMRFKNREEFIKKLEECEKDMINKPPELQPLMWNELSKICFKYIEEDTKAAKTRNRFRN